MALAKRTREIFAPIPTDTIENERKKVLIKVIEIEIGIHPKIRTIILVFMISLKLKNYFYGSAKVCIY